VFARVGATWLQQAYLKASNTDWGDRFGWAVSVDADTIAVGAWGESSNGAGVNPNLAAQADNSTPDAGAVYLYERSGAGWVPDVYLKASNPAVQDWFGSAVAISGDRLVVGAWSEASATSGVQMGVVTQTGSSANMAGATYVFARMGTVWHQAAFIHASNAEQGDAFGHSVAVAGTASVVGAPLESSGASGTGLGPIAQANNSAHDSGAVYVFDLAAPGSTPFCWSTANSTGVPAELERWGTVAINRNDLLVLATGLPQGTFAYFLVSPVPGLVVDFGGSNGALCIRGPIGRFDGPNQVKSSGASGTVLLSVDNGAIPEPAGTYAAQPGMTLYFQAWYRDAFAGVHSSNFTSGLVVTFE